MLYSKRLKEKKYLIVLVFFLFLFFSFGIKFVFAADGQIQDTFGRQMLEAARINAGLSTKSVYAIIGSIIKVILSLFGIFATCIVVYAGVLWMTSKGEPEKINKAKEMMKNALIGMLIVVSSYAITSFLVGKLTGIFGSPTSYEYNTGEDSGTIGGFGSGFNVVSTYPRNEMQNVKTCARVSALFNKDLYADSVNDSSVYIRDEDENKFFNPEKDEYYVSNDTFTFYHNNNDFLKDKIYRVTINSGADGVKSLAGDLLERSKSIWFRTSELEDFYPRVKATYPSQNATGACRNTFVQFQFQEGADPSNLAEMDPTTFNTNNISVEKCTGSNFSNLTCALQSGLEISSISPDSIFSGFTLNFNRMLDANSFYRIILKSSDHNPTLNPNDGIANNCGKPLDGNANGSSDGASVDKYNLYFKTGETEKCEPIITNVDPNTGYYNDRFDISGQYFGILGDVSIAGFKANDNCTENLDVDIYSVNDEKTCYVSWGDTLIQAKVPFGSVTGPLKVELTSDIYAQADNDFTVLSPYISKLDPDHGPKGEFIRISGLNFGNNEGKVYFISFTGTVTEALSPTACSSIDTWKNNEIIRETPNVPIGPYVVIVGVPKEGGGYYYSNYLIYTVTEGEPGPGLCGIEPDQAARGDPVNLVGIRFGTGGGSDKVIFSNVDIPKASTTSWADILIEVNVPQTAVDGYVSVYANSKESNKVYFNVLSISSGDDIYPVIVDSPGCTVESRSPSAYKNATDACINALVEARFNIEMDTTTFANNMELYSCEGQGINCNTKVTGVVSNNGSKRIVFTPTSNLTPGMWYKAVIKTGVKALGTGKNMQSEYTWNFKTRTDNNGVCDINLLNDLPTEATLNINETTNLTANPSSSSDICAVLKANSPAYTWTSEDESKVEISSTSINPVTTVGIATIEGIAEVLSNKVTARYKNTSITDYADIRVNGEGGIGSSCNTSNDCADGLCCDADNLCTNNFSVCPPRIDEQASCHAENYLVTDILSNPSPYKDKADACPNINVNVAFDLDMKTDQGYGAINNLANFIVEDCGSVYYGYGCNELVLEPEQIDVENNKILIWTPVNNLKQNNYYRITISSNVESSYDVKMNSDYVFVFKTRNGNCTITRVDANPGTLSLQNEYYPNGDLMPVAQSSYGLCQSIIIPPGATFAWHTNNVDKVGICSGANYTLCNNSSSNLMNISIKAKAAVVNNLVDVTITLPGDNGVFSSEDNTPQTSLVSVATCSDGIRNWNETSVDSGGVCLITTNPTNGECGIYTSTYSSSSEITHPCTAGDLDGTILYSDTLNKFTWTCRGLNGGNNVNCSANAVPNLNGVCGINQGNHITDDDIIPCAAGLLDPDHQVTFNNLTGKWEWRCLGLGTGIGTDCNALGPSSGNNPVNGVCGSNPGNYDSDSDIPHPCSAGDTSDIIFNLIWRWDCVGLHGGSTAHCNANGPIVNSCGNDICNVELGENHTNCPLDCALNCDNDNVLDPGEICDTDQLSGKTCADFKNGNDVYYNSGSLACDTDCNYYTGFCEFFPGALNGQCKIPPHTITYIDDADFSNHSANRCSYGLASSVSGHGPWNWTCNGVNGGTNASCLSYKYNSQSCNNNGVMDGDETGIDCGGTLCPSCSLTQNCGNGIKNSGEECDINDFGTSTCATFGFNSGNLRCTDTCTINTSSCYNNNQLTPTNGQCRIPPHTYSYSTFNVSDFPAICSYGLASSVSGTGPWNWTCNGINNGTNANCTANKANLCGNHVKNIGEECDDLDFGTSTCATFGFNSGNLICTGMCTINTVACSNTYSTTNTNGQCRVPPHTYSYQTFNLNNFPNGICSYGLASSVSGTGPWTWTCNGINNGTNASCIANKTYIAPPSCGSAVNNGPFIVLTNGSPNLCGYGSSLVGNVTISGDNNTFLWSCINSNNQSISCYVGKNNCGNGIIDTGELCDKDGPIYADDYNTAKKACDKVYGEGQYSVLQNDCSGINCLTCTNDCVLDLTNTCIPMSTFSQACTSSQSKVVILNTTFSSQSDITSNFVKATGISNWTLANVDNTTNKAMQYSASDNSLILYKNKLDYENYIVRGYFRIDNNKEFGFMLNRDSSGSKYYKIKMNGGNVVTLYKDGSFASSGNLTNNLFVSGSLKWRYFELSFNSDKDNSNVGRVQLKISKNGLDKIGDSVSAMETVINYSDSSKNGRGFFGFYSNGTGNVLFDNINIESSDNIYEYNNPLYNFGFFFCKDNKDALIDASDTVTNSDKECSSGYKCMDRSCRSNCSGYGGYSGVYVVKGGSDNYKNSARVFIDSSNKPVMVFRVWSVPRIGDTYKDSGPFIDFETWISRLNIGGTYTPAQRVGMRDDYIIYKQGNSYYFWSSNIDTQQTKGDIYVYVLTYQEGGDEELFNEIIANTRFNTNL